MQFMMFAINQEISELYYYKADVMKRFLLEYIQHPESNTYNKQFHYITEPFPSIEWLEFYISVKGIQDNSFKESPPCSESTGNYDIIKPNNHSCLFHCDNLWELEKVFLRPLRLCAQSFYILEVNGEHYGWVSPMTNQRLLS